MKYLLLFLPFISLSQNGTNQQIAMLNELSKKFSYIDDDFFPEESFYGKDNIGLYDTNLYPIIKKTGELKIHLYLKAESWRFVNKLHIKTPTGVLSFNVDKCDESNTSAYITEICPIVFDDPIEIMKLFATTPNIKVRAQGTKSRSEFMIDTEFWRDTYLFYQLLEKLGKFTK